MFDRLTGSLSAALKSLSGRGRLSEDNISETVREVRLALLDADVALPVVKTFTDAKCGTGAWTANQEQDIAPTGCLFLHPIASCKNDYDIVHLEGGSLHLGDRTRNHLVHQVDVVDHQVEHGADVGATARPWAHAPAGNFLWRVGEIE